MADTRMRIVIDADGDGAVREIKKVDRAVSDIDGTTTKAGRSFHGLGTAAKVGLAAGFGAAAVAAVEFGKSSVDAAIDAEQSMARTTAMLDNNVKGWRRHKGAIDDAIQSQMKLTGFDDEELYGTFARLASVTHDTTEALKLNALAADVSRARGVSLESVVKSIERAENGRTTSLSKLGIEVDKNTTLQEALGKLQEKYGGAAEKWGNTTAGQAEKMKVAWGNLQEQVGSLLLPVLQKLGEWFEDAMPAIQDAAGKVVDWIKAHWPQIQAVFEAVWDALKDAWKLAEPIFNLILDVAKAVVGWISDHWPEISAVIKTVAAILKGVIEGMVAVIRTILTVAVEVVEGFATVIKGLVTAVEGVVGGVKTAATAVWTGLKAAVTAPLDFLGWLNREILQPVTGFVGTVAGKAADISHAIVNGIGSVAWNFAQTLNDRIVQPLVNVVTTAFGKAGELSTKIVQGIGSVAWNFATTLYDRIIEPMANLVETVFASAARISTRLVQGIGSVAWAFAETLRDRLIQPIIDKLDDLFQWGRNIANKVWSGLSAAAGAVWDMVGVIRDRVIEPITDRLEALVSKGGDIAEAIGHGIAKGARAVVDTVVGAFKSFINAIIRVINYLPFVDIDYLAEGGVVRGPQMAVIGEDGPEAVIPLGAKRRKRGAELLQLAAARLGMQGNIGEPAGGAAAGQSLVAAARSAGVPLLADGGIFDSKTGIPKNGPDALANFYASQLASMWSTQPGEALVDDVKQLVARGLGWFVDQLPTPGGPWPVPQIGQGLVGMAKDFISGIFARRKVWDVDKIRDAYQWASDKVARGTYVYGAGHGGWDFGTYNYDCSGFASHAARKAGSTIGAPGTTASTLAEAHRSGANQAVAWGWRHMDQPDPRHQHMGIKILGEWFQFGPKRGGPDSQWDLWGVPPGLPGYASGTAYVPATGPAMLHQGEAVLDRWTAARARAGAGGGGGVSIIVHPAMGWLRNFIEVAVDGVAESARLRALAGGVV